jgi:hypothetical protein
MDKVFRYYETWLSIYILAFSRAKLSVNLGLNYFETGEYGILIKSLPLTIALWEDCWRRPDSHSSWAQVHDRKSRTPKYRTEDSKKRIPRTKDKGEEAGFVC